jgi:hypothetical protein
LLITQDKTVKKHSKVALNWQISFVIYIFASTILSLIFIGLIGLLVFFVLDIVFCIIAAVKASEDYKKIWVYPLSIPFLQLDDESSSKSSGNVVDADSQDKDSDKTDKDDESESSVIEKY